MAYLDEEDMVCTLIDFSLLLRNPVHVGLDFRNNRVFINLNLSNVVVRKTITDALSRDFPKIKFLFPEDDKFLRNLVIQVSPDLFIPLYNDCYLEEAQNGLVKLYVVDKEV